ncbi:response regulator [Cytophagales bacterium LB-30]|uniref:Response regulator n=1 Tax=Shiella aurantiaca TaxID=3058365 RepID=A0ABT8F6U0_9BACT|nr:response regulator [Shiella aurantiaca]MDN4165959.1 response regulator [Shiella aurantiaca]
MNQHKPIKILLVEDNEGDILLTTEALEEAKIINSIEVVKDGNAAIVYLEDPAIPLPDLILLDVNLPKKNGHEVLVHIKSTELLRHIPVIMLTTSSSEIDINKAYKQYASCYIVKPVEVGDFMNMVGQIEGFWFSIVSLPNKHK